MNARLQMALGNLATECLANGVPYREAVVTWQHELIARALARSRGNQTEAARLLHTTKRVVHWEATRACRKVTRQYRPPVDLMARSFARPPAPPLCPAHRHGLVPLRAGTLAPWDFGSEGTDLRQVRLDLEMRLILRALELGGTVQRAADLLKIRRTTLGMRLRTLRRAVAAAEAMDDGDEVPLSELGEKSGER